jgi:hypothetical protein
MQDIYSDEWDALVQFLKDGGWRTEEVYAAIALYFDEMKEELKWEDPNQLELESYS